MKLVTRALSLSIFPCTVNTQLTIRTTVYTTLTVGTGAKGEIILLLLRSGHEIACANQIPTCYFDL